MLPATRRATGQRFDTLARGVWGRASTLESPDKRRPSEIGRRAKEGRDGSVEGPAFAKEHTLVAPDMALSLSGTEDRGLSFLVVRR